VLDKVFKLFVNPDIDKYDALDKVFKLLNIVFVVDVKFEIAVVCPEPNEDELDKLFKLFVNPEIDKYDEDDKLFKLVNIVLLVDVKFDILVVCPLINNVDADENVFKLFVKPDKLLLVVVVLLCNKLIFIDEFKDELFKLIVVA
jgi:hypothetical protein